MRFWGLLPKGRSPPEAGPAGMEKAGAFSADW